MPHKKNSLKAMAYFKFSIWNSILLSVLCAYRTGYNKVMEGELTLMANTQCDI